MKFGMPQLAHGKMFFFGVAAILGPWSLYLLTLRLSGKQLKNSKVDNVSSPVEAAEVVTVKEPVNESETSSKRKVLIIYGTCTGTARRLAADISSKFRSVFSSDDVTITVVDAKDYDEFVLDQEDIVLFICSTWTDGVPPESAQRLVDSLKDYASDFRVSKSHLSKLKFSVFGLGGSYYSADFCRAAKDIHDCFIELGATPLLPLSLGDDSEELVDKFHKWTEKVVKKTKATFAGIELKPFFDKKYYESSIIQGNTTDKSSEGKKVKSKSSTKSTSSSTSTSIVLNGTATSTVQKDEIAASTDNTEIPVIDTKPTKMKFQKNVGKGKVSKANAFQVQQKLVKEEAKAPVSTTTVDVRTGVKKEVKKDVKIEKNGEKKDSGCCGGVEKDRGSSEAKGDSCCQSESPAPKSSCCSGTDKKENIVLDGNNKLGLEEEAEMDEDEEEEDRINNEYVLQEDEEGSDGDYDESPEGDLLDLEDIGTAMKKQKQNAKKEKEASDRLTARDGGREMVTKLQRRALTKEGYRIIGTHSAVKLCRWTKNQMRGRGGCYKHTFYGITSYQCMEATPSLACANKCVFCWRHHKNPVGTDWRWKTDDPYEIVSEAVELHRAMINEMRGVPGVQPERLADAFNVKHCALSLVGEPIMYPRINEMIKALHERKISTFLVTNAQFPDSIRDLDPITQLYVSVDASTRDSLKAIDRPLFKDFWERFLESLRYMAMKKQRTVYRLTLVKSWNMEEAESYVELIEKGQPDFIEIKSVTYCGKSDASSLTMENVPWHRECCQFSEAIANRLAERGNSVRYSIATEHEHSCCVLLAREDKFKVNGVWHTWIDYDKYHSLIAAFYESGGSKIFTSEDYMAVTPDWALYKSEEHGFDPEESRWKRNKAGALVAIEYKSSDSGCG